MNIFFPWVQLQALQRAKRGVVLQCGQIKIELISLDPNGRFVITPASSAASSSFASFDIES